MFHLDLAGPAARLVLDRPAARNAIPLDGWNLLGARIADVAASPARALVVTGAGGAFCAGADLSDFALLQSDPTARSRFRIEMGRALDALRDLAIPTVARIEGPCYGAGVAFAMACDLRVAVPGASFAITPAKIGISYPQEDVHRLVELVGPGQAARLLYTGGSVDAGEALRIGLVEEVGDEGPLVASLLANAPESLAALKRSIRLADDGKRQDGDMDRQFDALFAGEALAARLEARRKS